MKVCPATVITPVRADELLAATVKPAEPLPVPLAVCTVIQETFDEAVQEQDEEVAVILEEVAVIVSVKPPAAAVWAGGVETVYAQKMRVGANSTMLVYSPAYKFPEESSASPST
jgi:hypothetical protein